MSASKRRMRDFQRCLRTIQSFSDNQAQITEWDDEELEWITVNIKPKEGYYTGGQFEFKIFFEKDYPKCPPRVDCVTPIYHPNIDPTCEDYNVCLNLFDCWEDKFGLEDIVQGLLFLMYNPNIEDPLSPYFDPAMDEEEFKKSVEMSLQGEELDSAGEFPKNFSMDLFDEKALEQSINEILEKASQMVLQDEEGSDTESSGAESVVEMNLDSETSEMTMNAMNAHAEVPVDPEEDCLDLAALAARQESKVDKIETKVCDCDTEDGVCKPEDKNNLRPHRDVSDYIPRTFITPQPDFLVNAFMTCIDIVTS